VFDAHCHLTDLEDPIGAMLAAQAAGVRSMLTCGYDAGSNRAVTGLVERVADLPFALGLHPWNADQDVRLAIALVERLRPAAVGEIGLDLWGDPPVHPLARQLEVLEAQLDLAARLDLPVTLHSRKAVDPLLAALRHHPGVRGAMHAFSGSREQLDALLELGLYVGVGGAVTRQRARRVRRNAVAAPLERVLLETDAPAIGMDVVEPPHVRPAHLVRVAEVLAALRGIDPSELERRTDDNAVRLFGPIAGRTPCAAWP
jgi:TatD DNase family protein